MASLGMDPGRPAKTVTRLPRRLRALVLTVASLLVVLPVVLPGLPLWVAAPYRALLMSVPWATGVPPFQSWSAVAAIAHVTERHVAPPTPHRRLRSVVLPGVLVLAGPWSSNWSLLEPRSYFLVHRPAFDWIAAARGGDLPSDADRWTSVPPPLRWLVPGGEVLRYETAGEISAPGDPVRTVVVRQVAYPFDGGAGYLWISGEPEYPHHFGSTNHLGGNEEDFRALGGGWYWVD
jgi:hypothetical protein